jgi:hypothetical protein
MEREGFSRAVAATPASRDDWRSLAQLKQPIKRVTRTPRPLDARALTAAR